MAAILNKQFCKRNIIMQTALGIAVSNVIFMLVVAVILLFNCLTIGNAVAPESSKLKELRSQYVGANRGNNKITEQIRTVDLQARQQWFFLHERQRIGTWLLFISSVLFIAAMYMVKVNSSVHYNFPNDIEKIGNDMGKIRKGITITGICIIGFSIGVIAISYRYDATPIAEKNISVPNSKDKLPTIIDDGNCWTGFRGSLSYGASNKHSLPAAWNGISGKNILWKSDVPLPGYNSPVVYNGKVFISGGSRLVRKIFCYDLATGKSLWEYVVKSDKIVQEMMPNVSDDTGYAAATMATDGVSVYAIFATGELVCLDLNGTQLWTKNLTVPKNNYGYSSSLRAIDRTLIIQYDDEIKQRLMVLNGSDGKVIWEKERQAAASWSSPVILNIADIIMLIVITSDGIEAFNYRDGQLLWQMRGMGGEVATSAAFCNGKIFVSNDNACTAAVNAADGAVLWRSTELTMPDVASPIAVDDLLFLFSSHGVIQCVDANTGKLLWEKENSVGYYSSPLLVGKKIVAVNLDGVAAIIQPSRDKYIELDSSPLGEKTFATPALAEGRLFIRTNKYLYAIGIAK